MVNEKCKYYHDDYCNEDCTNEWVKCWICKEYLVHIGESMDINGYTVYEASLTCSDREEFDRVLIICPKCFEVLKEQKEKKKLDEIREAINTAKRILEDQGIRDYYSIDDLITDLEEILNE